MKRFFKTLLVCLVLVPALCLVTACGGGNNGGSSGGGGNGGGGNGGGGTVVAETDQQKYEVLIAAIGSMAQKSSYTVVAQSEEIDASTGNLQVKEDGEWVDADEEEQPEAEDWSSKSKNVATLNATTGEYAENSYVWVTEEPEEIDTKGVRGEEDAEEFEPYWQITEGEYIVKDTSGDEPVWIHYFTTQEEGFGRAAPATGGSVTLHAEYVSPDHAAHVYGFADANTEMSSMVKGATLEDAVDSLDQMLQLYLGFMSMGFELDLTDYDITTNPTTTITKEGDVYTLSITFTLEVTPRAEEEEEDNTDASLLIAEDDSETTVDLSATATFAITYTATEIRSYLSDMRFTTKTTYETENSKATYESTMGMVASAEITYEYDSNIMAEGIEAYTEAELEPEQALVYVALYVDGSENTNAYFPWGEDVAENVRNGFEYVEGDYCVENAHVDGWYYDAACTQKVDEEDEIIFKSWEKPILYARSEADEGYVLVIEKDGYILDPAQIEMAKQYGATVEDDGFYVGDIYVFTIAITDSLDFEDWAAYVGMDMYEVEKIIVDGVEYTEPITEHEEGHVYQVRVYADMNAPYDENGDNTK